jgi:hypothetical protein
MPYNINNIECPLQKASRKEEKIIEKQPKVCYNRLAGGKNNKTATKRT